MKKFLYAVTTVTLLATSCTNTDTIDEGASRPISFGIAINKNVKAAITGTTYPTNLPFGVFGYVLTNDQTWDNNPSIDDPIMDNITISYQSNLWSAADDTYYWPSDPTTSITFVAYSPMANSTNVTTPAAFTLNNGITFTDYTTDGSTDLLYSDVVKDRKSGSAVPILFKHALAQIYFTFKTDKTYDDITFTVTEIAVANVKNTASFAALPTPSWSSPTTDNTWLPLENGNFTFNGTESGKAGSELLLIPQDASTITVTVKYNITGTGVVTEDITKTVNLTGTWGINQRIKYTMTVSLNEITFDPTVTEWDTPTNTPL